MDSPIGTNKSPFDSRSDTRFGNGEDKRTDADCRCVAAYGSLRVDPVLQYVAWVSNSLPSYWSAPAGRAVRPTWIHDPCLDGTLFLVSPARGDRLSAGRD